MNTQTKIIIRNTRLFEKIKNATNAWDALFKDEFGTLEDASIPFFAGGLDHIAETQNQIVFHDRGCNGKDNTFTIRREVENTPAQCPICGAFLTPTTSQDFGGQEDINYYCKKCQAVGR